MPSLLICCQSQLVKYRRFQNLCNTDCNAKFCRKDSTNSCHTAGFYPGVAHSTHMHKSQFWLMWCLITVLAIEGKIAQTGAYYMYNKNTVGLTVTMMKNARGKSRSNLPFTCHSYKPDFLAHMMGTWIQRPARPPSYLKIKRKAVGRIIICHSNSSIIICLKFCDE